MNAEEAVRLSRLAAAAGLPNGSNSKFTPTALPPSRPRRNSQSRRNPYQRRLYRPPYINADPVLAKKTPGHRRRDGHAAWLSHCSNRGIQTRDQIRIIIEQATVPVVVDAGLGAPSHAAEAMEMGADAALVNTPSPFPATPIAWPLPSKWPSNPAVPHSNAASLRNRKQPAQPAP